MICFRCSRVSACFSPLRLAVPMLYMLMVAIAFRRGSILAALIAKLPLPQIPITPILFRSMNGRVPKKSTAALKSSAYTSGKTALRGSPSLPPQKDKSMDSVTKPRSAILVAYRFALCSLTAPIGCPTMMAGYFSPSFMVFGKNRLPATFILYWLEKETFSTFTQSLL